MMSELSFLVVKEFAEGSKIGCKPCRNINKNEASPSGPHLKSPKISPFHTLKPGFLDTTKLQKESARKSRMGNREQGRIQGISGENRPKQFQTENTSQKGGYLNGHSQRETGDLLLTSWQDRGMRCPA
jgi:hypothetical protein